MVINTALLEIAVQLSSLSVGLAHAGRVAEAIAPMEQACGAALTAFSGLPASFRFVARDQLPGIADDEHFLARIARQGLTFLAPLAAVSRGGSHLRRFSAVGCLCGVAAREMAGDKVVQCIFDVGDGSDAGDYHRFAFCAAGANSTLIPDPYFFETDGYEELRRTVEAEAAPWEVRRDVVFWRGAASGKPDRWPDAGEPMDWGCLQRLKLCEESRRIAEPSRVDVGLSDLGQIVREDIKERIRAAGFLGEHVDKREFLGFRYLVDIDGNTNSWGLLEKMIMGATIVKVASRRGYRQWFYDRLVAWENFVPVAADLSDMEETVAWLFANPGEAKRIAVNGAALAGELQFSRVLAETEAAFFIALMRHGVIVEN